MAAPIAVERRGRPSRLRIARLAAGLRLFDVEQATGIVESRLSRVERHEAPLREQDLARLAALYGLDQSELVDQEAQQA